MCSPHSSHPSFSLSPPSLPFPSPPPSHLRRQSRTGFPLPRHRLARAAPSPPPFFPYSACYTLIDLDRAPHPPPNYLSADDCRSLAQTNGPVFLLTIPPSVGYDNNPLSLYYCYEVEGSTKNLRQCIVEVTNTPWGERVSFLFDPTTDLVAKSLHVSPFMALKLWWKGVAFIQHPRYANVGYRREALTRDVKLQCCPAFSQDRQNHQPLEGSDSDLLKDKNERNRRFTWRDAKWPWC